MSNLRRKLTAGATDVIETLPGALPAPRGMTKRRARCAGGWPSA